MLISAALLFKFNGIYQDADDATETELINIYIGTAQRIISDYVGFDCLEVIAEPEEGEESEYSDDAKQLFKLTCLRIATLLQSEGGSNIGISNSTAEGIGRTFLNVVDYTPYLKQLSSFRKNTEV